MLDCIALWGDRYALVPWWDAPPGADWTPEPTLGRVPEIARAVARDGGWIPALSILDARPDRVGRDGLARQLARALDQGTLKLYRAPRPASLASASPSGPVEPVEATSYTSSRREPSLTWVAFQLFDLEQRPLASERFELVLPDGSKRGGTTDEQGFARVDDIPTSGTCELSLPDVDETYWQYDWAR